MNAPFKPAAPPEWNLADLYVGRDDPRIETDLAAAKAANDELASLEGMFLEARKEPERLGVLLDRGITLYEQATNGLWGVGAYAALAASVARDDSAWAKFEADLRTRSSQIAAESLFFTLELNQLEDSEIARALEAHPEAARWAPWLRRVRLSRPHELSPELERFIVDKAPAVANWVRLYDE
ncbi:MAG: oligoendopeptidase F, partial [Caulobacter sp.]